jgi:hypothetical protein
VYFSCKRKKIADKKLEEASQLAYADEILTAQGLIRHFDPLALAAHTPGLILVLLVSTAGLEVGILDSADSSVGAERQVQRDPEGARCHQG